MREIDWPGWVKVSSKIIELLKDTEVANIVSQLLHMWLKQEADEGDGSKTSEPFDLDSFIQPESLQRYPAVLQKIHAIYAECAIAVVEHCTDSELPENPTASDVLKMLGAATRVTNWTELIVSAKNSLAGTFATLTQNLGSSRLADAPGGGSEPNLNSPTPTDGDPVT